MENFVSAILGDLATRSISFLISKSSKPAAEDTVDRLRRVLFRAQVIVDEAIGRDITNHSMLLFFCGTIYASSAGHVEGYHSPRLLLA
jgi:hypothetical protein